MQQLNILSPRHKEIIKQIKLFHVFKNTAFIIVSIMLIVGVVFYFGMLLLQNYQKSLEEQIDKELTIRAESQVASTEDAIQELNAQLATAQQIDEKYISWPHTLQAVTAIIPDGIQLDALQLNAGTRSMRMSGTAALRENLLALQAALEESGLFSNISAPISNLTQKENINFDITGSLTDSFYEKNK